MRITKNESSSSEAKGKKRSMHEPTEKRQATRVEVQLTVDLRTKYIYTAASVLNISREGLFIKTQNPLPEGSEVEIFMHTPDRKKPRHFRGIVRWGRGNARGSIPAGMGVKLLAPNVNLIDSIARQMRKAPKNI